MGDGIHSPVASFYDPECPPFCLEDWALVRLSGGGRGVCWVPLTIVSKAPPQPLFVHFHEEYLSPFVRILGAHKFWDGIVGVLGVLWQLPPYPPPPEIGCSGGQLPGGGGETRQYKSGKFDV